jgi:DNA invertase Pin-like site-specific DNA recombinase
MYFNGTGVARDYSEASEGWRVLPTRYDDPAYSGGNLDRPALQRLLKDLHAEMVDVVVVYKIDRLTRFCQTGRKLRGEERLVCRDHHSSTPRPRWDG